MQKIVYLHSMSYKSIKSAFQTIASQYQGSLSFGYGTLNEMNKSDKNYPLVWWVLPLTVTDPQTNSQQQRYENWPITLRFVTSTELAKDFDDVDNLYNMTKTIADGFVYTLMDASDEYTISTSITKRQLFKVQDDVNIGWEYQFTLQLTPDIDYCCLPYAN